MKNKIGKIFFYIFGVLNIVLVIAAVLALVNLPNLAVGIGFIVILVYNLFIYYKYWKSNIKKD